MRGKKWEENSKWQNQNGWRFLCNSQSISLKQLKNDYGYFHKIYYFIKYVLGAIISIKKINLIIYFSGYPVVNDPLYNHTVFGPEKGRGGNIGKTDEELIRDLINIHNAENWLGMDGDSELSMFKPLKGDLEDGFSSLSGKGKICCIQPCNLINSLLYTQT